MTKKVDKATLKAAVMTVDDDVGEPTRRRASSFSSAVADLAVGQTASRAIRLDPETSLAELAERGSEWREAMRNNIAPAVRRAREQTGGEYEVEVSDALTPSRRFYIVAFVTRTA